MLSELMSGMAVKSPAANDASAVASAFKLPNGWDLGLTGTRQAVPM